MDELDFTIPVQGKAMVRLPILLSKGKYDCVATYVDGDQYIFYGIQAGVDAPARSFTLKEFLEKAGLNANRHYRFSCTYLTALLKMVIPSPSALSFNRDQCGC